jgi:hypothetical protein
MSSVEEDFEKGRYDLKFFAKRFLGINIHPGQVRLGNAYLARRNSAHFWKPAYLNIALSAGNRAGKTMIMAIVIFHSCLYKMGVEPVDMTDPKSRKRWMTHPYFAYHFAIQQETAELVHIEIANILAGIHVAQADGCPLADEAKAAGIYVAEWQKKDMGEYSWIVFHPEFGGAEIKFRTTKGNKGKGALGRDMHLITFDEAGLEENLAWIMRNVLHLRRMGPGGQIFLFSTPEEGLTDFADEWFKGDPDQPDRKARHMSLRMSTRDNVGFGIAQEDFDDMLAGMDEDHIKQNIDGYFIQGRLAYFNGKSVDRAFVDSLPTEQPIRPGLVYIHGVDPGTSDKCWSLVFYWDGTKLWGVHAEYSRDRSVDGIIDLAVRNHKAYAGADLKHPQVTTAIDTTGMGGHMFRELVEKEIPTIVSVEFGGNTLVKKKMLSNVKTMLDKNEIIMPRTEGSDWLIGRRELAGYKLLDRSIQQDFVMALVCVVKAIRQIGTGKGESDFDANAVDMSDIPSDKPMRLRKRRRQRDRDLTAPWPVG